MAAPAPGDAPASSAAPAADEAPKEGDEDKGESSKAAEAAAPEGSTRLIMFGVLAVCTVLAIAVIGVVLIKQEKADDLTPPKDNVTGAPTGANTEEVNVTGTTPEALGTCVPDWTYEGKLPEAWKTLKCTPENKCGTEAMQSPVNLPPTKSTATNTKLTHDYTKQLEKVTVTKDKFLKMTIGDSKPPTLVIAGTSYFLKEVHFRIGPDATKGSEHILTGSVTTPLEVQFFHVKDSSKDIIGSISEVDSVVALSVLYEVDGTGTKTTVDTAFASLQLKLKPGQVQKDIKLNGLLPDTIKNFFLYSGSLTYPPCSEGVKWVVVPEALKITQNTFDVPVRPSKTWIKLKKGV